MISFHVTGNFNKVEKFLLGSKKLPYLWRLVLNKYGKQGVAALKNHTPVDTGATADAWTYRITRQSIIFENSKRTSNPYIAPLVILLQYGHATRGGAYVQGIDFINPALRPIFDKIAIECWKEVEKL